MAKEEKFTFLSADGKTTIHAVKWIPEDGKYEAILQITHGMIEFVERYRLFAEFLTENGFMVVGHDHLGIPLHPKMTGDILRKIRVTR